MKASQTKNTDISSVNTIENRILQSVENLKIFLDQSVESLEETSNFLNHVSLLIADFIKLVEESFKIEKPEKYSHHQYFSVVVYLMQYGSPYQLFKDSFRRYSMEKNIIMEIKRCISKQLTKILENINIVLEPTDDTSIGSFLNLMDIALDKIAEVNINQNQTLRQTELSMISYIVEEILCFSMSVAHVAIGDDNKIITASCRSVLNAVENLKLEINNKNPNKDMCNLVIDTCSDSLCAAEGKVNTAVLRLCLKIFSEYKGPMENLYKCCKQLQKYDKDILDPLITEFDLHMDRIFQICAFSIASSSMGKRVADIKNILANLEFLESELVPRFIGMINCPLNDNTVFGDVLKNVWCLQMKLLRKTAHGIIEPTAYCKLVYDELEQEVENLWKAICDSNDIHDTLIDPFILYTKELGVMLTECLDSFENEDDVSKQLKVVYKVLHELTVCKNLLACSDTEKSTASRRVFKRCKVLLATIKRLGDCINKEENNVNLYIEEDIKNNVTFKLELQDNSKENNDMLETIIIKSRQIIKERSICHFNQTFSVDQILKEDTKHTKEKLLRLKKNSNLREYSYRQSQVTANKLKDFSIAEAVLSQLEDLED